MEPSVTFEYSTDRLELSFRNYSKSLVNAVRRTLWSDVGCIAFNQDTIEIPIYTIKRCHVDFIRQRISHQPLNYDITEIEGIRYCLKSKGSEELPIINTDDSDQYIYTNDMVMQRKEDEGAVESKGGDEGDMIVGEVDDGMVDRKSKWVDVDTPKHDYNCHLFTLRKGESILAYMYPEFATGKKCSNWKPVTMDYKFMTELDLGMGENNNEGEYPHNVKYSDEPLGIKVGINYNGTIKPITAYERAISHLEETISTLKTNILEFLDGHISGKIIITPETENTHYTISINGEGHTLGNLVQTYYNMVVLDNLHETKSFKKDIRGCGASYKVPHPLIDTLHIDVRYDIEIATDYDKYESKALVVLLMTLDRISTDLNAIKEV